MKYFMPHITHKLVLRKLTVQHDEQTGTLLLLPNKASLNARLVVHQSVIIFIDMLIGYT